MSSWDLSLMYMISSWLILSHIRQSPPSLDVDRWLLPSFVSHAFIWDVSFSHYYYFGFRLPICRLSVNLHILKPFPPSRPLDVLLFISTRYPTVSNTVAPFTSRRGVVQRADFIQHVRTQQPRHIFILLGYCDALLDIVGPWQIP